MSLTTKSETGPVILWLRKDLRLRDNHALSAAVETGRPVVPVYIREPGTPGAAQEWWLHHSLEALETSLNAYGLRLILRTGGAASVIESLAGEIGSRTVVWNRRYDPDGMERDAHLKARLKQDGFSVASFGGFLLHEPWQVKTGAGGPYRVYTPFWRALDSAALPDEPLDAPDSIPHLSETLDSEPLSSWALCPTKPDWAREFSDIWTPGEAGANARLESFIETALDGYKDNRDRPAIAGTSMLSPHLAFGEIAPARIWHAARKAKVADALDSVTYRKELVWREFSYHLLFHHPRLAQENLNARYDVFPWQGDDDLFKRWTRGQTGYPIVDAGMRQLWRHGYMHNRVRMIAASFLIKDLLIDWRRGEKWFADTLVDADPASNAASWQWVAGSGADAAPFFRIFNPTLQGEKFDPDGSYVKTFVPELDRLDRRTVHRPFEASPEALRAAGVRLGETYPDPIVNHATARARALAAYAKIKDAA